MRLRNKRVGPTTRASRFVARFRRNNWLRHSGVRIEPSVPDALEFQVPHFLDQRHQGFGWDLPVYQVAQQFASS